MARPDVHGRLADLLDDPREDLRTEIKRWLDLDDRAVQADLARELIALANHGGGLLLFGFTEGHSGWSWTEPCPFPAELFSPDAINNICKRYAEPSFQCDVRHLRSSAGNNHVVIEVPGGHRVPIRTKRGGPDGSKLRVDTYYVRRPGPESAPIGTGQEWDTLLKRCISNQREDLLDGFRAIVGAVGADGALGMLAQRPDAPLVRWRGEARRRLDDLVSNSADSGAADRYARGTFSSAYRLLDLPSQPSLPELLEALRNAEGHETGWPAWVVLQPRPVDGAIQLWEDVPDAGHADFWRVTRDGKAFLLRGYQEDFWKGIEPGRFLSLTIPTLRAAECLLHASRLASALGANQIEFSVEWTGLRGRVLKALEGRRYIGRSLVSHQDTVTTSVEVEADAVSDALPELVKPLLDPLYEIFDFFQVPPMFYAEVVAELRGRR